MMCAFPRDGYSSSPYKQAFLFIFRDNTFVHPLTRLTGMMERPGFGGPDVERKGWMEIFDAFIFSRSGLNLRIAKGCLTDG